MHATPFGVTCRAGREEAIEDLKRELGNCRDRLSDAVVVVDELELGRRNDGRSHAAALTTQVEALEAEKRARRRIEAELEEATVDHAKAIRAQTNIVRVGDGRLITSLMTSLGTMSHAFPTRAPLTALPPAQHPQHPLTPTTPTTLNTLNTHNTTRV